MAKVRVTKKLKEGCWTLAQEHIWDSSTETILTYVQAGKVKPEQIYQACEHFGYRWKEERWRVTYPTWMLNILKAEGREILLRSLGSRGK
jgi:hypothetical protein